MAVRTSVDLPDPVFRDMKAQAARSGSTVKEFLLRAIERELALRRRAGRRSEVKLPLIRSKRPGALRSLTNAEIEDLLD
jgi:hypothetical protein